MISNPLVRHKAFLSRAVVAMAIVALMAAPALAQTAGSFRGEVVDSTGAVIPGATATLTNDATRFSQNAVTGASGEFYFGAVEAGLYTLRVELPGFKAWESSGLRVGAADSLSVPVQLEIGQMGETLTVTAERALIQTETGAREGLITPEQIETMSIFGRNPTELLRLLPGVVAPNQDQFGTAGGGSGFGGSGDNFSINGARAENTAVSLDGANVRDIGNNSNMFNVPNNDFVAEVKIQTSNYAAEFGNSAVTVQAITKSGSSEFHGSAYYYTRPYQLQANDRSRNYAGQERPESKFTYPGFTVSGPILIPGTDFNKNRDKMFFFFGYEWQNQEVDTGSAQGVTVTDDMRAGNFSSYLGGQNLDLGTTLNIPSGFPGAGTPVPGRDMSPYINPLGQSLFGLYPDPNFNDPNNRYNYITSRLANQNRQQGVLRVDYNISESTRMYVRLARDKEAPERYRGLWWNMNSLETPTPLIHGSLGRSAVVNVTSVLSPTITNEFIFSWSKLKLDVEWKDPSLMEKRTYGVDAIGNPFGASPFVPELVNEFNGGRASMWYAQDVDNIFAYNGFTRFEDRLTKVMNTHAIKVGLVVERGFKNQNFQNAANIQYNFAPWGYGSTGNVVADILAGRPANAELGTPSAKGLFKAWNIEAFIQDSWKIRRNFTLDYGLRFGYWGVNTEVNDLGGIFEASRYDPSFGPFLPDSGGLVNGVAYSALGQVPQRLTDSRPLLWMPRLNFAWDVKGDGDIILRGGSGIFFTREQGNAQYDIINLSPNAFRSTLDAGSLQSAFPGQGYNGYDGLDYQTTGQADPQGALNAPGEIRTPNPNDLDWPTMYNASVSVSKRLPWRNVIEVGYVGTWGRNLVGVMQQNVIQPGQLYSDYSQDPLLLAALDGNVYDSFKPYPSLSNVRYPVYVGTSKYNSLQATLARQSGSFTYLVAYTFSHAQGTTAADHQPLDPIGDFETRNFGTLRTDRRQILNLSWTWRLGAPASGGIGKALLNDWNLSGISTWIGGQPRRPAYGGDLGSDQVANAWWGTHDYEGGPPLPGDIAVTFNCDPNTGAKEVGEKIWDISCLGIPAFGTEGPSYPPNIMRLPSRTFHDLTIFKDFPLGGSKRLQFRIGFFNLFNQAFADMTNNSDIDLTLDTSCNVRVNGVPNGAGGTADVCDATQGFTFDQNALENFGKIITKHGHRSIELALRFFW